MIRQHFLHLRLLLSTMAAALIISGCGGGSSGSGGTPTTDNPPTEDSATISGTAAAGAPISGIVGARDASGETLTTDIEEGGSFELDLSSLSTPVLLYASGIAGGNAYQVLSVAFADDLNGTANITPLTNLIVGNSVGRSPQEFFNNPDFDQIRQATIENQEEALRTRLKPLLDALGVEEDFNLRNSPFTADRSGFDGALDVIEVQVDPDTSTATITNRINPNQTITNNFVQPESEETTLDVDETEITEGVTALQALNTLANSFANALENQNETALEGEVTADFLNNGESINDLFTYLSSSAPGIEDAGELAAEIRNWSIAELSADTAKLNIGAAQGPWNAFKQNGEWKFRGNQLEFFVFVEPTHRIESGAETPVVLKTGTLIYAGFPSVALGELSNSTVGVSGDLTTFNGALPFIGQEDRFASYQFLNAGAITSGDQVTFTWNNPTASVMDEKATYTIRRGSPDLSNGAPEITSQSADLAGNEYTYEWTLPPGYDSTSVRNNFTGQTSGGEGNGFTGNPLDNDARSFTGTLPESYVPSTSDELRIIARDPFGVFVDVGVKNPFADQVPPAMAEDALIGSWIARNTNRGDNAPWVQLTFLESGHYMHQELDLPYRPEADSAGSTGLEFGQYTWDNQTGEVTVTSISIDDNGSWGLTSTFTGDERLNLQVDGDTLSAAFNPEDGPAESVEFTRVPLNQSGITGSWIAQDSSDPSDVTVITLLDDGFYFAGTSSTADSAGFPGLEFGTYTYKSDTLVLQSSPIIDQNGEVTLSDPIQGFYYSTVIDGSLIVDDSEVFQLSELAPGVAPSDGTVTVNYVSPGDETPAGPAVTGDFHYLRSAAGIESSRLNNPPTVFQAHYAHVDTSIVDNADGTGTLSWTDLCVGDLLIDAGASEDGRDAVFDSVSECLGLSNSFDLSFTETGLFAAISESTITNPEDGAQIINGATEIDFRALDAERSLFIASEANTFQYEEGDGSFTDGRDMNTHVLSKKDPSLSVDALAGDWGFVTLRISGIEGDNGTLRPNEMRYGTGALNITVNTAGNATLTDETQLEVQQGLKPLENSDIVIETAVEEAGISDSLGIFTVASDGTLSLLDGELGGFASQGADVITMALPNPFTPYVVESNESSFLIGVKLDPNFQATDLAGKSYDVMLKGYFAGQNYYETDIFLPGATLEFDASGVANAQRGQGFSYSNFGLNTDVVDVSRESATLTPNSWTYQVDASTGLIRMESSQYTYSGGDTAFGEQFGYSSADNKLLVLASRFYDNSGGTPMGPGGTYVTYAICNNCD